MAEQDIPGPVQRQHDRMRERIKCPDVFVGQTLRRPQVNRWRSVRKVAVAGNGHQVSVRVSANQEDSVAEAAEAIQHLARLRPGGNVSSHDYEVGASDVGFGEHRIEGRQNPMNVRYDRNPLQHQSVLHRLVRSRSSVGE